MEIKAEKQHARRSALAVALSATIILTSTFTVAAVQKSSQTSSYKQQNIQTDKKIEFELPNGDVVVGRSADFDVSVDVVKAKKLTIDNCGTVSSVMMAQGTVQEALDRAGIVLKDNQCVIPSPNTTIDSIDTISIYNSLSVTVTADSKTFCVRAPYETAQEALQILGYAVGENDIVNVGKDTQITDGMHIILSRVSYTENTTVEKINYKKTEEKTDKLNSGKIKVKVKGKDGEKQVTRRYKYIDGKLDSAQVLNTTVTKEPVDQVTLVGTKDTDPSSVTISDSGNGTFTDSNGKTVSYKNVLTGSGTAYTAPSGAGTATGVTAYHGGVAVNPNIIPYGTKLYIVSTDGSFVYGYATAVDTGGALMEGSAIVDCFYNTYDECVNFGRRNMKVYILS